MNVKSLLKGTIAGEAAIGKLASFQLPRSLRDTQPHLSRQRLGREQISFQAETTLPAIDEHIPKPFGMHSALWGAVGLGMTILADLSERSRGIFSR